MVFGEYTCIKCRLYENNPDKVEDIFHCVCFLICRMNVRCVEEGRLRLLSIVNLVVIVYLLLVNINVWKIRRLQDVRFAWKICFFQLNIISRWNGDISFILIAGLSFKATIVLLVEWPIRRCLKTTSKTSMLRSRRQKTSYLRRSRTWRSMQCATNAFTRQTKLHSIITVWNVRNVAHTTQN